MSPSNKNECRVIKGNEKKVKKLKVGQLSTSIQKRVFNVSLTNDNTHMITYTDKALENALGYSSFDAGGCKMAKETRNQCVLVSVINSVAFLLRTDKNVESVVEKLSSHFLDEGIMKKRAKEYPKEHLDKLVGVKGSIDRGWYQYDLRNLIRDDCNKILSDVGLKIRFSENLSRICLGGRPHFSFLVCEQFE